MIDDADQSCDATADGIMKCLRMLAEEAASLNLARTLTAIHEAALTCQNESGDPGFLEALMAFGGARPLLH